MDDKYSQRELTHFFEEIHAKLEEIHTQTKKTNGRVSSLENWRWAVTGAVAILSAIVIPMLYWIANNWKHG